MGVVPAFTRTASTFSMERADAAAAAIPLVGKDDKERRHAQFRSKSMSWREPTQIFQRMSSRKVGKTGSRSNRQKDGQELHSRPSKWTRFWRKLRGDGVGKKVHAARPEWLNYDTTSYSMNFEMDRETPSTTTQLMPKISGPGARVIVTVLLQRSPSTNRNSGCILIPKPIPDAKPEANAPLWKRRSVQAPLMLDVRVRGSSFKRRPVAAGA